MTNPEHLEILKQGVKMWNKWRLKHGNVVPKLLVADLHNADPRGANLREATLVAVNFSYTNLNGADFTSVRLVNTTFADNDLSEVKGLETIQHYGSSSIGVDTLYRSGGRIPEIFLRGCGVPDDFITFYHSLIGTRQAIQFYSCFISYSTRARSSRGVFTRG